VDTVQIHLGPTESPKRLESKISSVAVKGATAALAMGERTRFFAAPGADGKSAMMNFDG